MLAGMPSPSIRKTTDLSAVTWNRAPCSVDHSPSMLQVCCMAPSELANNKGSSACKRHASLSSEVQSRALAALASRAVEDPRASRLGRAPPAFSAEARCRTSRSTGWPRPVHLWPAQPAGREGQTAMPWPAEYRLLARESGKTGYSAGPSRPPSGRPS